MGYSGTFVANAPNYRSNVSDGGRIIKIIGNISDDNSMLRIEELRARVDNIPHTLDLEDGSEPISAKLGPIETAWTVEDGVDRPAYQLTFYETC